jgi:hypothetical protein
LGKLEEVHIFAYLKSMEVDNYQIFQELELILEIIVQA